MFLRYYRVEPIPLVVDDYEEEKDDRTMMSGRLANELLLAPDSSSV